MLANWILLLGTILTVVPFLYGLVRSERNVLYNEKYVKYFVWTGIILLVYHAIFYLQWRSLAGL